MKDDNCGLINLINLISHQLHSLDFSYVFFNILLYGEPVLYMTLLYILLLLLLLEHLTIVGRVHINTIKRNRNKNMKTREKELEFSDTSKGKLMRS